MVPSGTDDRFGREIGVVPHRHLEHVRGPEDVFLFSRIGLGGVIVVWPGRSTPRCEGCQEDRQEAPVPHSKTDPQTERSLDVRNTGSGSAVRVRLPQAARGLRGAFSADLQCDRGRRDLHLDAGSAAQRLSPQGHLLSGAGGRVLRLLGAGPGDQGAGSVRGLRARTAGLTDGVPGRVPGDSHPPGAGGRGHDPARDHLAAGGHRGSAGAVLPQLLRLCDPGDGRADRRLRRPVLPAPGGLPGGGAPGDGVSLRASRVVWYPLDWREGSLPRLPPGSERARVGGGDGGAPGLRALPAPSFGAPSRRPARDPGSGRGVHRDDEVPNPASSRLRSCSACISCVASGGRER